MTKYSTQPSPYLVPFDNSFRYSLAPCKPERHQFGKKHLRSRVKQIAELQRALYAEDKRSVLLVFQAMDAAGKDGTVRAVMSGINPAGCQVSSFKQPSKEELDHDFLWRTTKRLPERGRIGIFNRSYYEEVLVVRVHPEYLSYQRLPEPVDTDTIWAQRFESIRAHEQHLARNGTVILKFWLNVSKEEQRQRFLSRLDEPEKHWKFSAGDVAERGHFETYMAAYQEALNATSRPWAPWYAIPADDKKYMRYRVADIISKTLAALNPRFPNVGDKEAAKFDEMRRLLNNEGDAG